MCSLTMMDKHFTSGEEVSDRKSSFVIPYTVYPIPRTWGPKRLIVTVMGAPRVNGGGLLMV